MTKRINTIRDTPGVPVWQRKRLMEDKLHPANFPADDTAGTDFKLAHIRSKIRQLGVDEVDVTDAVKWSRS